MCPPHQRQKRLSTHLLDTSKAAEAAQTSTTAAEVALEEAQLPVQLLSQGRGICKRHAELVDLL